MSAPLTSLHTLLATEAADASSAVFVYDTTPTAAFGNDLLKGDGAEIWQMQTRPGAGSAFVGFVESVAFSSKGAQMEIEGEDSVGSAEVPSKRATRSDSLSIKKARTSTASTADKPVTILGSTSAFLAVVPSILSLPAASIRPTIVAHISAQASSLATDEQDNVSLEQVPDLSSLFEGVQALEAGGWTGAVVLSESAEEAAFVGTSVAKSVAGAGYDLINVFDGVTAGRQLSAFAPTPAANATGSTLVEVLGGIVPFFSYFGSASATQVLVLPASTYSASAKAAVAALESAGTDVGILVVRVVKPWNAAAFLAILPTSTKTLHVFSDDSEQSNGPFYDDVLTTLLTPPGYKLKIRSLPIPTASVLSVQAWASKILSLSTSSATSSSLKALLPESGKLAVFWNLDNTLGGSELVPARLASAFADVSTGVTPRLEVLFDNFRQGGLQQASLLLESSAAVQKEHSLNALVSTSAPALLFLSAPAAVLKAYDAISPATVGPNTRVVLAANWTAEELATKLPLSARKTLVNVAKGTGNVVVIDIESIAKNHGVQASEITELVFWSLYLPATLSPKDIVAQLARTPTFATWENAKLVELSSVVHNALVQIEVDAAWAEEEPIVEGISAEVVALPTRLVPTAAGPNADRTFPDPVSGIIGSPKKSWHDAAHRLMYPEAFKVSAITEEKMRPDLPEKTYVVTVSENRRLTPTNYDRNVFHIEFDTNGTGLKYDVGEALGIHGWNDAKEVLNFLEWYGLDPDSVVTMTSRETGRVEQRTTFQVFQQNLDMFGKPGKSFYETLSRYATDKREERALRFIACPDGAATFKKMSENDTVTYADLLRQFPSAKPTVEELVREIEEIKPRHYSIASSQNFVGNSVHLLVVTVEWMDPRGSPRFGQCTRYLNGLKVGDKVTVSVKPSVMKLPVLDTAPIIMAGLGTGAAPFRAFIQERAYQKSIGKDVGPALYYFGSRHRSKEYLYGLVLLFHIILTQITVRSSLFLLNLFSEEIEAYVNEGVITHTGLAFSRDTNKKVYIQDKMNEDSELLARMLKEGTFYLCGPTWPVPDVYEALVKSLAAEGRTLEEAQARIEELKEAERYILEVYQTAVDGPVPTSSSSAGQQTGSSNGGKQVRWPHEGDISEFVSIPMDEPLEQSTSHGAPRDGGDADTSWNSDYTYPPPQETTQSPPPKKSFRLLALAAAAKAREERAAEEDARAAAPRRDSLEVYVDPGETEGLPSTRSADDGEEKGNSAAWGLVRNFTSKNNISSLRQRANARLGRDEENSGDGVRNTDEGKDSHESRADGPPSEQPARTGGGGFMNAVRDAMAAARAGHFDDDYQVPAPRQPEALPGLPGDSGLGGSGILSALIALQRQQQSADSSANATPESGSAATTPTTSAFPSRRNSIDGGTADEDEEYEKEKWLKKKRANFKPPKVLSDVSSAIRHLGGPPPSHGHQRTPSSPLVTREPTSAPHTASSLSPPPSSPEYERKKHKSGLSDTFQQVKNFGHSVTHGSESNPAKNGAFGGLVLSTSNLTGVATPNASRLSEEQAGKASQEMSRSSHHQRDTSAASSSGVPTPSSSGRNSPTPGDGTPKKKPAFKLNLSNLTPNGHHTRNKSSPGAPYDTSPMMEHLTEYFSHGSHKDTKETQEERENREWEKEKRRRRKAKEKKKRDEVAAILERQQFIMKLARVFMMFGAPSHRLEAQMQATARVLELNVQVVYIPGVMLLSFGDSATHTSDIKFLKQANGLDLGKLLAAYLIYYNVIHDIIGVTQASTELDSLMTAKPKYKLWQQMIIGGLASAFIQPSAFYGSFIDMLMAIPLGAFLVLVQVVVSKNDLYSSLFEIVIAAVFSFISAALGSTGDFCFAAVVSGSIVLILPGYIVLCGSLELANRSIISGSVRLVFSILYSLFLGFGTHTSDCAMSSVSDLLFSSAGLSIGAEIYYKITSLPISKDYTCSSLRADAPWYRSTIEPKWFILTIPCYLMCLSLRNGQPMWRKETPIMVLIGSAGYVANYFAGKAFVNRSDISSALGSLAVGIIGNLYGKFSRGSPFVVMVAGILLQLPSGLSNGGLLQFTDTTSSSTYSSGFETAESLIEVAVGLTVGLFVSTAVVNFLFGGGRRRGSNLSSF
ncbi:hypothetical protein P7C70_g1030, partial [Phenoliferia sp. Uapishka_3]